MKLYFSLFFNAYASAIISPTILFSSFFLSFNNGNNNSATSYASSKCGYPDKTNVSIPNDSYSLSFLLLYADRLQVQYLPHLLQVRYRTHKLGLISNDSLSYLYLNVSSVLTNRIISCKCLLSKLNCFIIHILN